MLLSRAGLAAVPLLCLAAACGGGATVVQPGPGGGSAVIAGSPLWSAPGGSPANLYLAAATGPEAVTSASQVVVDYGASSAAQIAPDGSVLVGAGTTLVSFSRDGAVNWRYPTARAVREFFIDAAGNSYFEFDNNAVHVVSPAGQTVREFELPGAQAEFRGVSPSGLLFIATPGGTLDDPLLQAWDAGGLVWEYQCSVRLARFVPLSDGGVALADSSADLLVLNGDGTQRFSVLEDGLRYEDFWEHGEPGGIRVSASEPLTGGGEQIIDYSAAGVEFSRIAPQLGAGNYVAGGTAPGGSQYWYDGFNGLLALTQPDGALVWEYADINSIEGPPVSGHAGGVIIFVRDGSTDGRINLLGFDAVGNVALSLLVAGRPEHPAVDAQGRVCFGNNEGMFAYNADASFAWGYDFGGAINSAVCTPGGAIAFAAGNVLYACNTAGAELWRWSAPADLGAVVAGVNGEIHTHTSGSLFTLSADGALLWQASLEGAEGLQLSADAEGHVYLGTSLGTLVAFLPGGLPSWEYVAGDPVTTRAAIGGDGALYFGCAGDTLRCVSAAGAELWRFDMQGRVQNTPAAVADSVYAVSVEGGLFNIDSAGNLLWRYQPPDYVYTSPSIGPDGTVYFGTDDFLLTSATSAAHTASASDPVLLDLNGAGYGLYAVNPDGSLKWDLHTNHGVFDSVAVDAAGTLYLGVYGQLFALNPDGTERWRLRHFGTFNGTPSLTPGGAVLFPAGNVLRIVE